MAEIINTVKNSKAVCTLAVIKLFGKGNPETPYAFAREGYSMALDFIHTSYAVSLIAQLDGMIRELGGAVYKTKDAFSSVPAAVESTKFQSLQNTRYAQP